MTFVGKLSARSNSVLTFSSGSPAKTQVAVTNSEDLYNALFFDTVSKIVAAPVKLTPSTSALSSDSAKLTINGKGFDAWQQVVLENNSTKYFNSVKFTKKSGGYDVTVIATWKATMTRLVASFTHLAPANTGALKAAVTVHGTWSTIEGVLFSKCSVRIFDLGS